MRFWIASVVRAVCLSGLVAGVAWGAGSAQRISPGQRAGEVRSLSDLQIPFVWCPPGKFQMGSPASEPQRNADEAAVLVTLTKGFWLAQHELTQGAWESVMGTSPWKDQEHVRTGSRYPATNISFEDLQQFLGKWNGQERGAGRLPRGWSYHLPTEAQWEYACRAGTQTMFFCGDDASRLKEFAWYGGIVGTGSATGEPYAHLVGTKRANPWGLYDMHGNVWEWCRDIKQPTLPGGIDPLAAGTDENRVIRAGSWRDAPNRLRSAYRYGVRPFHRKYYLGARLAIVPD